MKEFRGARGQSLGGCFVASEPLSLSLQRENKRSKTICLAAPISDIHVLNNDSSQWFLTASKQEAPTCFIILHYFGGVLLNVRNTQMFQAERFFAFTRAIMCKLGPVVVATNCQRPFGFSLKLKNIFRPTGIATLREFKGPRPVLGRYDGRKCFWCCHIWQLVPKAQEVPLILKFA